MIQRGQGPGFAAEARQAVRVGGDIGRQHLERDIAAEPVIVGPIHVAHSAGAEPGEDPVGPDHLPMSIASEVYCVRCALHCVIPSAAR